MATSHELLAQLLKAQGLSITKPRRSVFEALLSQEPLTMHELVDRTPQIDRASVYRTVELFERLGIIQRLTVGWKYKLELSDKFAAHHHHITCTQCGRTVALSEHELEQVIDQLATQHGFVATGHQIEIQGTCETCRGQQHHQ